MIASTAGMFSTEMLAGLLRNKNQRAKDEQAENILSNYIFRYEREKKQLITIQQ